MKEAQNGQDHNWWVYGLHSGIKHATECEMVDLLIRILECKDQWSRNMRKIQTEDDDGSHYGTNSTTTSLRQEGKWSTTGELLKVCRILHLL